MNYTKSIMENEPTSTSSNPLPVLNSVKGSLRACFSRIFANTNRIFKRQGTNIYLMTYVTTLRTAQTSQSTGERTTTNPTVNSTDHMRFTDHHQQLGPDRTTRARDPAVTIVVSLIFPHSAVTYTLAST